MMQKINVIDLDSTLLPYDSFGTLVKRDLKKFNLFVWGITILRVLRIVSSLKFKQVLITHWEKKHTQIFFDDYANTIYKDLDKKVLDLIASKTELGTINILLSASPDLYVQRVIELLEWEGRGSYFNEGQFVNLYSQEKINWVLKNYPNSRFEYCFAISDSHSDDKLLSMFNEHIFWKN